MIELAHVHKELPCAVIMSFSSFADSKLRIAQAREWCERKWPSERNIVWEMVIIELHSVHETSWQIPFHFKNESDAVLFRLTWT